MNVNDPVSGSVTLANVTSPSRGTTTLRRGDTLSASATVVDPDGVGALVYQWLRGGVAITGATGTTYTLVAADVATAISVRVSMTHGFGTVESIASATSAPC